MNQDEQSLVVSSWGNKHTHVLCQNPCLEYHFGLTADLTCRTCRVPNVLWRETNKFRVNNPRLPPATRESFLLLLSPLSPSPPFQPVFWITCSSSSSSRSPRSDRSRPCGACPRPQHRHFCHPTRLHHLLLHPSCSWYLYHSEWYSRSVLTRIRQYAKSIFASKSRPSCVPVHTCEAKNCIVSKSSCLQCHLAALMLVVRCSEDISTDGSNESRGTEKAVVAHSANSATGKTASFPSRGASSFSVISLVKPESEWGTMTTTGSKGKWYRHHCIQTCLYTWHLTHL